MGSNYGQKSLLVAVQSCKGHTCFTKPFLIKIDCKISGWRFLKILVLLHGFLLHYAGCLLLWILKFFYNIPRACLLNRSPVPAMDLKSNRQFVTSHAC